MIKKITAIVLAAGLSRRMGKPNKLLLPFEGKTILGRVVDEVMNAPVSEVIVVTGHEADELEKQLDLFSVKVIFNEDYKSGMTTSIQSGVRAASLDTEGFMVVLGDQVFLKKELIHKLIRAFSKSSIKYPIIVPSFNRVRANPVIFHAHYQDAILNHTEMNGCKKIIRQYENKVQEVEITDQRFMQDIDSPEDYQNLRTE